MPVNINIDIGLSVLCAVQRPGETLTHKDIADVCLCNHNSIHQLEQRALKKLRERTTPDDFYRLTKKGVGHGDH